MRRILPALIMALALMFTFNPAETEAGQEYTQHPDFDFEYIGHFNLYGGNDNYDFEFEVTNADTYAGENLSITMERYDPETDELIGIPTSLTFSIDEDGNGSFYADASQIFDEDDLFYVQLSKDGYQFSRHYVAPDFHDDWTNDAFHTEGSFEKVAIGDIIYGHSDYVIDYIDHEDGVRYWDRYQPDLVTTEVGDHILMHYRFSVSDENDASIMLRNPETGDEHYLSKRNLSDYMHPDGVDDSRARRGFVALNTGPDEIDAGDYMVTDRWADALYDDSNIHSMDMDAGVYEYGQYFGDDYGNPDADNKVDGESVLIVTEEDPNWEIDWDRNRVRAGDRVLADLYQQSETAFDYFELRGWYDSERMEYVYDETDGFDEYANPFNLNYRTPSDVDLEDGNDEKEVTVEWHHDTEEFDILIVPPDYYDQWDLGFELEDSYTIRGLQPFGDALNTFLNSIGMGDETGQLFFSAVVMIAVSVMLGFYGMGMAVIMSANAILLMVFALVGLIPAFVVVILGIVLGLGVWLLFTNGAN